MKRLNENNTHRNLHDERRKEVFEKLKEDSQLPSPSATVMEVLRLCNSEESSLNDIADLIQTDPALSAEIIKYANSAFLATGVQVASIQKATVKLGMNTVVTLALGFSLLADNRRGICKNFDYPLFWRTSLAEALAARELSRRGGDSDPNEIFICGLLAHIGSLALATLFPQEYARILENQPANTPPRSLEQSTFGIDSGEFTTELFLDWGLPAQYALAAGFHEDLDCIELGSGATKQASIYLLLAHVIALMCQSREAQPEMLQTVIATARHYDVDIGNFGDTFHTIVECWHNYGRLFDIDTTECYDYSEEEG